MASLTKGRITVLENPERIDYREFQSNPNTVNDSKSVNWGDASILGSSHPISQFGSGGERLISFELYLDALKSGFVTNGKVDLTPEIRWWRSLIYPIHYATTTSKVSPPKVSFTFGSMWSGVICIVKKVDVKITFFSVDLAPMRATVSIDLKEVISKSQVSSDIYSPSFGPGIAQPPPGANFI